MGPLTKQVYEFISVHPQGVDKRTIFNQFPNIRGMILIKVLNDLMDRRKIHDRKARCRIFQAEEQLTFSW